VTLAERLVELHRALDAADLPHAFGGAISLAYWTLDPRATSDLDVNIFVPAEEAGRALRALPRGIAQPPDTAETVARDRQVRLWWDETPVDLFFDYDPVHADAARNRRIVPFADTEIPVLGPVELTVFKVAFDRTRDWADIEAIVRADTVDLEAVRATLRPMLDAADPRWSRLEDAARRAGSEGDALNRAASDERAAAGRSYVDEPDQEVS
jgi:hypothetical protein